MPPAKSSTKKKPAGAPAPQPAAEAAVPQSSSTPSLPPALTNPDTVTTYKSLYDVLGRAYWESSDLTAKDTIQGARDSIYEILTDLNAAKLEANTALFLVSDDKDPGQQ